MPFSTMMRGIPSLRGGITVKPSLLLVVKKNPLPARRDYRERGQPMNKIGAPPCIEGLPGFTQEEVANRLVPSMRGGITASASSSSTAPSYPLHVWRDYRRELGIVTPAVESPPCVEGLPGGSLLIVVNQGIPSLCGGITEKVLFCRFSGPYPLPVRRDCRGARKRPDSESIPSLRGWTICRFYC